MACVMLARRERRRGKIEGGTKFFSSSSFFFLLERILKFQFMVAVEAGKKNVFFDLLFSSLSFFSPSLGYKSGRATNCELELSFFVFVSVGCVAATLSHSL